MRFEGEKFEKKPDKTSAPSLHNSDRVKNDFKAFFLHMQRPKTYFGSLFTDVMQQNAAEASRVIIGDDDGTSYWVDHGGGKAKGWRMIGSWI